MTCGVEVPVKLPMPSAEHVEIGAIHAIISAAYLKALFVMASSLSANGRAGQGLGYRFVGLDEKPGYTLSG
jgi:hypothetical protein